jgi:hypothetical protein
LERVSAWPASAPVVEQRPEVRVVPLGRYPYRLYYSRLGDDIVVVALRHFARRDPKFE